MKTGPNWFPTTYTGAAGQVPFVSQADSIVLAASPTIWNTQNMTASFTSLRVSARGAYDLTVQLTGTISTITQVEIDVSIDPAAAMPGSTTATWFPVGTIGSTPTMFIHTGIKKDIRVRTLAVSNTDNFSVLYMLDDRG